MSSLPNLLGQPYASIPVEILILYVIALVASARGFTLTVYFISTGYAFSILGMAVAGLVLFRQNLAWYSLLHSLALGFYGLRLGTYLLKRESQPAYKKELASFKERAEGIDFFKSVGIWLGVSLLYVVMFSPNLFGLLDSSKSLTGLGLASQIIGLTVMFGGLGLEALADKQKSDFKAINPGQFCNVGLYQWVRCPNYLGEITFWIGNLIMGMAFYSTLLPWILGLAGTLCITLIMMGSTKRLESSQDERYGALDEYQAYVQSVPVLIPFVSVYSLKKIRVYLE
jgi:steroid 5-alpha reductase family enzyme